MLIVWLFWCKNTLSLHGERAVTGAMSIMAWPDRDEENDY